MKKILISGLIIAIIATSVFFVTKYVSGKKAHDLAMDMIQNIPGVTGWSEKGNSYNYVTKNLVYKDLEIAFTDNSTLKFGTITADSINKKAETITSLLFQDITYSKNGEIILHIDDITINELPYKTFENVDWKKIFADASHSSKVLGFWAEPVVIFDNLTAKGIKYTRNKYVADINELFIDVKVAFDRTTYTVKLDNTTASTIGGMELFKISGIMNNRTHNRAAHTFSESYDIFADNLAVLNIFYTINDFYPDKIASHSNANRFFSNIIPAELTIAFKNDTLMEKLYELGGMFTGYSSDEAKTYIISAVKNRMAAEGSDEKLIAAVVAFLADPGSIEYRMDKTGASVSVNGGISVTISNTMKDTPEKGEDNIEPETPQEPEPSEPAEEEQFQTVA